MAALQFQRFSPLSSWQEAWHCAGRHGAGEGAESATPFFFPNLFLFIVHWCLLAHAICVKVSDPLELELQTGVSCHVGAGN